NKSVDTYQNMKFSKEKIDAINPDGKIAFSTTNFHVFRSGIFARRFKMRAIGVGAKTKWYFWPNASVREFACLLTKHKLKQAVIFTVMLAVFTGLVLFVYR
ncbi:YdcF family protein, partial [bacterium]|nr:YdcF family protein [bacterium]